MEIHADFWPGQRLSKKLFEKTAFLQKYIYVNYKLNIVISLNKSHK